METLSQKNKKSEVRYDLPVVDPGSLTRNNLWDSDWLMEKYPERFSKKVYDYKNTNNEKSHNNTPS